MVSPNISPEQELINHLTDVLILHSYRYYVLNNPIIEDADYDNLFKKLKALEEQYPQYVRQDTPTQRVGSDLGASSDFERVPHLKPVLSLANAFDDSDLDNWANRNQKLTDYSMTTQNYILEPKLDGLTMVVTYKNGVLYKAVTRGTGSEGDDVTANARTIRNLPLSIPSRMAYAPTTTPRLLVVRGEVLFTNADFKRFNEAEVAKGNESYKAARNAASGSLKQKYPTITGSRPLSFFVYDIMVIDDEVQPLTHYEALLYMHNLGFAVVPYIQKVSSLDKVKDALKEWDVKRKEFMFETDGVVIKIDDLKINDSLGYSGKDPRGSIAYKFKAEEAVTKLLDVTWTVGRSGRLTPNAVLEPVYLGGTTISAASLHNMDKITEIGIRIGDMVTIKRAGEVIPHVIGYVEDARTGVEVEIKVPTECPVCHAPATREDGESDYNCSNRHCPERIFRNIENFVSKEYYDIDGVGSGVIRALYDAHIIADESDIFFVNTPQHIAEMMELDKFGEKKVEKILEAIEKAKEKGEAWQLLASINISNVGKSLSKVLMAKFGSIPNLMKASKESISDIEGVGTITANNIIEWFKDSENLALIEKFKAAGLNFGNDALPITETKEVKRLSGKSFVVTGSFKYEDKDFPRSDIEKIVEANGGKNSSSVSKKTDYVLVGENAGSKEDKAKELNIRIIDMDTFFKLVYGSEPVDQI